MPEQRRIAVIVISNDPNTSPNMADVMNLVLYSPTSVLRYIRDTTDDYFVPSPVDFFGACATTG